MTSTSRTDPETVAAALRHPGYAHVTGPFPDADHAFSIAAAALEANGTDHGRLEVIGDYVIPPPDGPPSRDFQTLHFDFGLPVRPVGRADVARFTGLYVSTDRPVLGALTRIVPLDGMLAEAPAITADRLRARLEAYGATHGAFDDTAGYYEGSLARVLEAARPQAPVLPSLKSDPSFLCGTEFATLDAETQFLAVLGVDLGAAEITIALSPGQLLLFDNLRHAHGRRGRRLPGELHQRVFGHRALTAADQRRLCDAVLARIRSPARPG